jgi:sigma-B regulation protein RsbU (phosphoserine phosphatase)
MSFRKKLIILLACLSIAPILALRAFGIHNVHLFADEVIRQVHFNHQKSAELRFNAVVQHHQKRISRTLEQLETALLFQAYEARNLLRAVSGCQPFKPLAAIPPQAPPVLTENAPGAPGALYRVYGTQSDLPGNADPVIERFKALLPVYRTIEDHLGSTVLRHYTMINHWVSVYPCGSDDGAAAAGDYGAWYPAVLEERLSYWSAPYIDPDSGRAAIALSLPLYCQEEDIFGVTSIIIDLDELLGLSLDPSAAEAGQFAFIGKLTPDPQSGHTMIRVFSRTGSTAEMGEPLETINAGDLGLQGNDDPYRSLLNDFRRLRSTIHKVRLKGHASYWAFSPLPHQGVGLVLVVPVQDDTAMMDLLDTIRQRTQRVEWLTAVFLVLLALAAIIAAVTFSRIVTKPLEKLTRAAQKLAGGNLQARVAIDSHDEIGALAGVFNRIGPELSRAYAMQRSVELASEIQEHLLPHPPRIAGFDIFGLTLYSNLAGGDYYDFLCDEADQGRLCVAIGDVSGHGISSALLMASVRSALRMRARLSGTMSAIAQDANAVFSEDVEASGNFVTLFLARLDRDRRRIQWVRAGHDPALLYDPASDTFTTLKGVGKGLPFGIDKAEVYLEESHPYHPGQILFLGTDGIWEARDAGGRFFGKKRVKQIIKENADADAKMIVTAVIDAVEAFQADSGRSDDVTCVVVKFIG